MRAPTFSAVLFDLDGTLADSAEDIIAALALAFADVGVEPAQPLHLLVDGSPLEVLFAVAAPGAPEAQYAAFAARYRAHYDHLGHARTRLYPGVRETLEALALLRPRPWLAVAPAKRSETARSVCAHLGVESFFAAIEGTGGTRVPPKPAPDLLLRLQAQAGVPAERCLLVGDTLRDVRAGQAAGMRTAAATWGLGRREDLARAGADHVLEDMEDLLPLFVARG